LGLQFARENPGWGEDRIVGARTNLGGQRDLGAVVGDLAEPKEGKVEEEHLMPNRVHIKLSVPPKDAVSSMMGFRQGKGALHIARVDARRRRNFVGQHFWAQRCWVSTGGPDAAAVRRDLQEQEQVDQRREQLVRATP
jgi:putative transposase